MTFIAEKIAVIAREFVETRNVQDSKDFNEPFFQTKLAHFDWDMQYSASSIGAEIVLKSAWGAESIEDWQLIDRICSPSAVATHCNWRGCKRLKTGNIPEVGAIAFYRRGNSWQGSMSIVIRVAEDKERFDVAETRFIIDSGSGQLKTIEVKDKRVLLPFKSDKLNLLGFGYPPNRELK